MSSPSDYQVESRKVGFSLNCSRSVLAPSDGARRNPTLTLHSVGCPLLPPRKRPPGAALVGCKLERTTRTGPTSPAGNLSFNCQGAFYSVAA
jgi:hypothetical protein